MWVAYDAYQVPTTNTCEAFDGKLNGRFYHAHPLTFLLIEALLEVQDMSYLKMRTCSETEKIDPKETIIEDYMTRLDGGDIDRFTFVHNLSRKFLPPKI